MVEGFQHLSASEIRNTLFAESDCVNEVERHLGEELVKPIPIYFNVSHWTLVAINPIPEVAAEDQSCPANTADGTPTFKECLTHRVREFHGRDGQVDIAGAVFTRTGGYGDRAISPRDATVFADITAS
jgi:hypothetical protein